MLDPKIKQQIERSLLSRAGVNRIKVTENEIKIWVNPDSQGNEISNSLSGKAMSGIPIQVLIGKQFRSLQQLEATLTPFAASEEERTSKWRPVPGGVSIGHYKVSAGTNTVRVWDVGNRPLLLSNTHIIAPHWIGVSLGDPILQPGVYDGGLMGDRVAELLRFEPLKFGVFSQNLIDAAVALPTTKAITSEILEIGDVVGVRKPLIGEKVFKSGRSCGLKSGKVMEEGVTIKVAYTPQLIATFVDQIVMEPILVPGDSGSLIVGEDGFAVGLGFAGSEDASVANPLHYVISKLQISFLEGVKPTIQDNYKLVAAMLGIASAPVVAGTMVSKYKKESWMN